ncbi:uncharacterized protein ATC70_011337 [Mucor velutinosus]|uniref:Uncharacterized protein n=1 Tax=Mucor velutinosus TaxID=708070 RepID=A0AAN7I0W9_9FUNG|nr:hypothetical protein ATC70_011337 [Mucor velutinosus]
MQFAQENPGTDQTIVSNDTAGHLSNPEKLESHVVETEDVEDIRVATNSVDSSELTAKIDALAPFEKDAEKASVQLPSATEEEEGPDGGYGWFVVLGAFAVQITSFGVVSSW